MIVEQKPEETEFIRLNRSALRRTVKQYRSQKSRMEAKYEVADQKFHQADRVRVRQLSQADGLFVKALYRGDSVVYIPFADSLRDLAVIIEKVEKKDPEHPMLSRTHNHDFYRTPVRGTSLADIEKVDLPLTQDGAQIISRIFWRRAYYARLNRENNAQEVALNLPTEAAIHEGKLNIPHKIRPLLDRLQAYFDYSIPFFTRTDIDPENELNFLWRVGLSSGEYVNALSRYLPVRLGISPSSVAALYDERQHLSANGFTWRVLNIWGAFENGLNDAYPTGTIPAELEEYLKIDKKSNKRAASFLNSVYAKKVEQQIEDNEPIYLEKSAAQLEVISPTLREDILKSRQGYLSLSLEGHPDIDEVIVTCHNKNAAPAYKKGFIVILKFKDGKTHLTIEIKDGKRIFGVPGQLTKENPHIGDYIAHDLVTAALDYVKQKHPQQKVPEPAGEIAAPGVPFKIVQRTHLSESPGQAEAARKEPKVKTRGIPFLEISASDEFPTPEEPISTSEFTVFHTRDMVQKMLGRSIRNGREVDRIMKTLARFEVGATDPITLQSAGGKIEIRVGDRRVIIQPGKENTFELVDIVRRDELMGRKGAIQHYK